MSLIMDVDMDTDKDKGTVTDTDKYEGTDRYKDRE
jgi:hypothetical protein